MKTKSILTIAAVGAVASWLSQAAIISTFDTESEGWIVADIVENVSYSSIVGSYDVQYYPEGGNPGGWIYTSDPTHNTFYFQAPGKFLGNRLGSYGQTLSFDVKDDNVSYVSRGDVVLVGAGLTLVIDAGQQPGPGWTSYGVTLTEGAGWTIDNPNGQTPTAEEFRAVLSALDMMLIRGEYGDYDDNSGLDNVALGVVPEPQTLGLGAGAGLLALALARRWRR